ncbi:MAG: DNA primase [Spirochaetaceae bacterium]|nr:DNA primase [Treponema sp.]MBP3449317.1 DNA primase [Spirochaetaceae bacterium]MBQ7905430.1 DNA primase [Spirochaetaceae bacterium]
MAKISSSTIDEVNARTDIISLIGEYTRLERRGSDWWGCCPFHNEKTPSFHVVPDKRMYHCFGCGQGGSAINFVMEIEKLSFTEAVVQLAKKTGIEVVYEGANFVQENPLEKRKDEIYDLYSRTSGTFHFFLTQSDMGKFAFDYLISRGVSKEIIEKFQLGYSPSDRTWLKKFLLSKNYSNEFLNESGLFSKKYPDIAFFSDRLMFPIFNRKNQVVAFGGRILHGEGPKYLNSGEMIQYKKGETLYAFNFAKETIRKEKSVIFCEGYMDVIAYHQAGITNAVAPLGTALTEGQVKLISSFVDTVYLSLDSDDAGQNATYKAILLCRKLDLPVKVIKLEGGKDPSEILNKFGLQALTNAINDAIIDSDFLLSALSVKYNIGTPDGKTKASLDFFPYVDALSSDIQKDSCLEKLCQTYNLKPEAVKADFNNRENARNRIQTSSINNNIANKTEEIKLNAESRAMLAVVANIDYFSQMRNCLSVDDFEDALARDMFIALEECYREGSMNYDAFLSKCTDERVQKIVTKSVISGEFTSSPETSQQTIEDCIWVIKKNSLERKRDRLVNQIRQCQGNTLEEQQKLDLLLNEKISIDLELNNRKKKDAIG